MKPKTRKKLSKILKILAVMVIMTTLIVIMSEDKPTFADSGFSASYGGGSSSSGGGFSSSHSSSSYSSSHSSSSNSSGDSSTAGIILIFIFIFIFMVCFMIYFINSTDKKAVILRTLKTLGIIGGIMALIPTLLLLVITVCNNLLNKDDDNDNIFCYILVGIFGLIFIGGIIYMVYDAIRYSGTYKSSYKKRIRKRIEQRQRFYLDEELNKAIPNFNKEEFLQTAFEIYKDVQIAWMNFDLDSVKDVITDEMYNMYEAQLATLEVKGEKNMMENMKLKSSIITDITSENEVITITTVSEIIQKDYIIEAATGKVLRGNKYVPMHMIYEMKYRMSIDENAKLEHCPNCGAQLENMNGAGTCKYCGSKIVAENTKWVLTEKKVLMQR